MIINNWNVKKNVNKSGEIDVKSAANKPPPTPSKNADVENANVLILNVGHL